jgi:hypothetical protein
VRRVERLTDRYRKPFFVLAFATLVVIGGTATVRSAPPASAPPAQNSSSTRSCDKQHVSACRRSVAYWRHRSYKAEAAVTWQRHSRAVEVRRVLEQTRGRQPFAYAAKLAYLACRSFSATPARCRPASEMLAVGRCESGLQNHDPNPTSTADGWMQFLSGTWYSSTAGQLGYSRFDALAMGIATEALVHQDGSWRQWVCQP